MSIPKWLLNKPTNYIKSQCGCAICGERKVKKLAFHHVEPLTKKFNIGNRHHKGASSNTVQKELEKCVVVCKDCHTEYFHPTEKSLYSKNSFLKTVKKPSKRISVERRFKFHLRHLQIMIAKRQYCEYCGEKLKRTRILKNRHFVDKVGEVPTFDFISAYNLSASIHNLCTKCAIKYRVEQDNLAYMELVEERRARHEKLIEGWRLSNKVLKKMWMEYELNQCEEMEKYDTPCKIISKPS